MVEGDTLINAAIGAVANLILSSFIPFAPVFGGALAGYLQGGNQPEGIRVGAIAGALALIPGLLFGFLVLSIFVPAMAGESGVIGLAAFGIVGIVIVAAIAVLYLVGLSALGGLIGYKIKCEEWVSIARYAG